jgi:hypothetical protein
MDLDWQPTWVDEGREPNFSRNHSLSTDRMGKRSLFGKVPGIDCLQLCYNEGIGTNRDLKLCFAGERSQAFDRPISTMIIHQRQRTSVIWSELSMVCRRIIVVNVKFC